MASWMPRPNANGTGGVLDLDGYKRSILERAGINPDGPKRKKSEGASGSSGLKDPKLTESTEPPKEVHQKRAMVIGELQENFKALTNGNGNVPTTATSSTSFPPPTPPKPTLSQPLRHSESSGDNGWFSVGSLQQPEDKQLSIEVPTGNQQRVDSSAKWDSEAQEIPEFMLSPDGSHPSQSTRREAYHRYIQRVKEAGEQPYHLSHISSMDSTHSGSVKERVKDFAHIIEKERELSSGSQQSSRPTSTTPTHLPPAPIHKIIRTESVEQRRIFAPSVPVKPKSTPNIVVDTGSPLPDTFETFGDFVDSSMAESQEVSHIAYLAEISRANREVSSRVEALEERIAVVKSDKLPPLKLSSLQIPNEETPKLQPSKPKYTQRRQTTLDRDSFDDWRNPQPTEEMEKLRREVVKQQTPRSPRTPEWRKTEADQFQFDSHSQPQKTSDVLQSDYIAWPPPPPPEKLYPRRNLADMITSEPTDKTSNQHVGGGDLPGSARSSDQQKASVTRSNSKRLYLPNTVKVKSLWESRIDQAKSQPLTEVSTKRWKSLEVITASLSLPKDDSSDHQQVISPLQQRQPQQDYSRSLDRRKLKELQRADSTSVTTTTSSRRSQLNKGRSVDNLSLAPVRSPHMWYDSQRIKEAVSHESIADAGQTKSKWEKMSDAGNDSSPRRNGVELSSATLPRHHKVNDHHQHNYDGDRQQKNKKLTQASDEIRENLNVIEREIEDYKQRERELRSQGILKPFEQRRNTAGTPVMPSYSQEFSQQPHQQQMSDPNATEDLEMEKELLLLYIRSKPQVLESLGVHLPSDLKRNVADTYGPKVELRPVGELYPLQRSTGVLDDTTSSFNGSNQSTLERIPSHLKGRYQKNQQHQRVTSGVNKRLTTRKPSFDSVRDSPVQKRSSSANSDRHAGGKPTENLILYEIMEQREREEELKRSRSSLGLPSLDDILSNWRSNTPTFHSPGFTLKSSQSFDHLTHAVENEMLMERSYGQPQNQRQNLSTSMDQLQMDERSLYDPYKNSTNFASLSRPVKQQQQATVERNIPISYNNGSGNEPDGYKSVSRVQLVNPNSAQPYQHNSEEKPMIVRQPSSLTSASGVGSAQPRMYSLLRSPVEKSFEKLVKQAGSGRPVVEIPPTYRRRVEFVPVETRIEQEVEELRRREEELRRQRISVGLHYTPIGLVDTEESEDAFSNASTSSDVRHREYIGQRNPTFTPTYSTDAFDYDRRAEPNQVHRSRNQPTFSRVPNR